MSVNDHGSCVHCGYDLNGGYIYDSFLEKYGNHVDALATASMYGAKKDYGRWGKSVYVTLYDGDTYANKRKVFMCPKCRKECYNPANQEEVLEEWDENRCL